MRVLHLALLVAAAGTGFASPHAFVVNNGGPQYDVNMSTNSEVALFSTGFSTQSLAIDGFGSRYSADAAGDLYNVTSPFPFLVASLGMTQIGDLDYGSGGLWGFSNASQTLFRFDLGSNSISYSVTITGAGGLTVTGVAYDDASGDVYLSGNSGYNTDLLLKIASSSTSAMAVGSLSHGDAFSDIADIEFAGGTLYAMTWYHRYFYTVNPNDASLTLLSAGPHRDVTAMAVPVPEPATLGSLAVAMLLLVRKRRRA